MEKEKSQEKIKLGKKNRRKGIGFERKVARELSKHTGDRWIRTPYSGAGHIAGDIMRLSPFSFPYAIECKNRADITLLKVLKNPEILRPYMKDMQIIIFNDNGCSLVVIPEECVVKSVFVFKNYFKLNIAEKIYYLVTLKSFFN